MRFPIYFLTAATLSACGLGNNSRVLEDAAVPAPTSPDLTVAFSGDAEIVDGKIRFSLEFRNIGLPMAAETAIKTKAMMFPKVDYSQQLVGNGLVLETIDSSLMLATGESKIVAVEKTLPNMPSGVYFLGATTNTDASATVAPVLNPDGTPAAALPRINEALEAQLNNATPKLINLGNVSNLVEEHGIRGKYDLSHEVQGAAISMDGGTASHSSRNILRVMDGEAVVPPNAEWRRSISARFVFADLENGTLSLGAYTRSSFDKVWTAISWNPEADAAGHAIYVDYYSNAPMITHLPAGNYVLGVLMNVNDAFELDSYPENNLDLTFMNLKSTNAIEMESEAWVNVNEGGDGGLRASINDRADGHEWSYSIDNPPSWLQVTAQASNFSYNLRFKADALAVPLGMNDVQVTVKAVKAGQTFEKTSTLRIFKNGGPVLQVDSPAENQYLRLDSPNVTVTEINGIKTVHYEVTIKNGGNETLYYSINEKSPGLSIEEPTSRVIAGGSTQKLKISFIMVGMPLPLEGESSYSYMSFQVNSNGGTEYVSTTLELGAVAGGNGGGEDDDDDDDDDDFDGPILFPQPV